MAIKRNFHIANLVRELAENRVNPLEIIREALSNAKDHKATRVWVRTAKDQRNEVSITIIDDGEGMDEKRLAAFWGVGASIKSQQGVIGYKGHGTKLYFDCRRLSVATSSDPQKPWCLSYLEQPLEVDHPDVPDSDLDRNHPLHNELEALGLLNHTGTAILIEQLRSEDRDELLHRLKIESFCDWFTVIGDVRSGLFDSRLDFHRTIEKGGSAIDYLRQQDAELRPIAVYLRINGEKAYSPIGMGPASSDRDFLKAWPQDVEAYRQKPSMLSYGHRFADVAESEGGATRVRNDMSSLRLTERTNWISDDGISIVARVEGHRRQIQTYYEASWQGKPGLYPFEQRFGLWLCKDFIPVTQRNDLLRTALDRASPRKLKFDLNNLRNWQVFVNDQMFKPTANRNDIANQAVRETKIVTALVEVLKSALDQKSFRDWVERLRSAALERDRNREVSQMARRMEDVEQWLGAQSAKDGIDPMDVVGLHELTSDYSLRIKAPDSEQELFYVYGLLSGRFEMPVHIIEYDASEGVDAIGKLRVPSLVSSKRPLVRVEFKLEVMPDFPIHHFFEAIDIIICWKVHRIGDIYEESSATIGKLRKRHKSMLKPPIDTHEIEYDADGSVRVIPIIEIASLFPTSKGRRSRRG